MEDNNQSDSIISEPKAQFQKINGKVAPILDVKHEKCCHDLCPYCNELGFPSYTSFVCHTKDFSSHSIGSSGRISDHLSTFYRSSVNDVRDFMYECSSTPSSRWIFDSVEVNMKAKSLLESSLLFHLGTLDDKMSEDTSQIVSTHSYRSTSSANFSFSKGLIYCVWKRGLPCFVFSSEDNRGDVYVANPVKIESSANKALDYVYVFRSRTSGRKNCMRRIVGKMKVSSSLVLNSNRSSLTETEFVLFGCHEDHSKDTQSSPIALVKSKGLSKKVSDIFRPSHNLKHMSKTFICELEDVDEVNIGDHVEQDFAPNLELAAIIVKDHEQDRSKEVAEGGWGLKFLNKDRVSDSDTCQDATHSSGFCKASCKRMHVLIPAGFHGGPIQRTVGPSTLTDRWRSGGCCDCGGWDIGCPLTVFESDSDFSNSSLGEETEDHNVFSLFVEGKQHGEPMMRMVGKSEGVYHINFRSSLSVLQCFSIAVAVIHTRFPDLCPKM